MKRNIAVQKAAVNVVVAGVGDILATAGAPIDVSVVHSDRARKALYAFQGIYVPAEEIRLPSSQKAYFVPLKSMVENLLQHPGFLQFFKSSLSTSTSDLLRDFTDGTRFQTHPLARSHQENTIVMTL